MYILAGKKKLAEVEKNTACGSDEQGAGIRTAGRCAGGERFG